MSNYKPLVLTDPEFRSLDNPTANWGDLSNWTLLSYSPSTAGETVTRETAMTIPAVWSAVNQISGTIASLPLHLYRNDADGNRTPATSDPLYRIVHNVVNSDGWSSVAWRKWMVLQLLLTGRAFTLIQRNRAGRVMGLWPLDTPKMEVVIRDGRRSYIYRRDDGTQRTYGASDILDIVYVPSPDGMGHLDPITTHRESLGLMLAQEKFAARFFGAGGLPPMVMTGPAASPAAAGRAVADANNSLRSAGNIFYAPKDHDLKPVGLEPAKTQLLESRQWMISEVARMFGIPNTLIQDLSQASYSNVEQLDIAYRTYCILPLIRLIQAEMNAKLFAGWTNEIEFALDGLQAADFATRMAGYQAGIHSAIYTPDEARGFEGRPSKPGGDQLFIQGASIPLTMAGQVQAAPKPEPSPVEEEPVADEPDDEEPAPDPDK